MKYRHERERILVRNVLLEERSAGFVPFNKVNGMYVCLTYLPLQAAGIQTAEAVQSLGTQLQTPSRRHQYTADIDQLRYNGRGWWKPEIDDYLLSAVDFGGGSWKRRRHQPLRRTPLLSARKTLSPSFYLLYNSRITEMVCLTGACSVFYALDNSSSLFVTFWRLVFQFWFPSHLWNGRTDGGVVRRLSHVRLGTEQ